MRRDLHAVQHMHRTSLCAAWQACTPSAAHLHWMRPLHDLFTVQTCITYS